jgi:hypothetical protein
MEVLLNKFSIDDIKELDSVLEKMNGDLVSIQYETKEFNPFYFENYFLGYTDCEGIHIGSDEYTSCVLWEKICDIIIKRFCKNIEFIIYLQSGSVIRINNEV